MPTADDRRIDRVWNRYKRTGSKTLRNELIERYLPLVQHHAERLRSRLPAVVQADELSSAGTLGLMDAIEAFDPRRQIKFSTFSAMRIRGAMMDELRSMDWVPRLVRHRERKVQAASAQLEIELGRPPRQDELAAKLDLAVDALSGSAGGHRAAGMTSLSRQRFDSGGDDGGEQDQLHSIQDTRAADPAQEAQRRFLHQMLSRGLTRAERLVLTLYYYEEMTMREIGQTLDLSESRVSQMHTDILKRLRTLTKGRSAELHDSIAA